MIENYDSKKWIIPYSDDGQGNKCTVSAAAQVSARRCFTEDNINCVRKLASQQICLNCKNYFPHEVDDVDEAKRGGLLGTCRAHAPTSESHEGYPVLQPFDVCGQFKHIFECSFAEVPTNRRIQRLAEILRQSGYVPFFPPDDNPDACLPIWADDNSWTPTSVVIGSWTYDEVSAGKGFERLILWAGSDGI